MQPMPIAETSKLLFPVFAFAFDLYWQGIIGLIHMEVVTALYLRVDVSQNRMASKTHPSALVPMPSPKP